MDYLGILKKSLKITLHNKYLWIFAILAGGAGSSWGSFSNSATSSDKWDKAFNQVSFDSFWSNYGNIVMIVIVLIVLLGLIMMILSTISQGAILGSVEKIEKGQKNNFWIGLNYGWHKFWRVFAVGLLLFLIIFASIIIWVVPLIIFVISKIYVLAIIWGILVFMLELVFWLYFGVMSPYILRIAVLGDKGAWMAIMSSWKFFLKHVKDILIVYLLLMAVGFVVALAIMIALILIGGLLVGIGYGLYLASMAVFWMYVAVFGFAFIVFCLILGGVINTFQSSVITLVYLELVKS